jgi:phosphoglycolate phosphatase-like HAD superfamily hydrolase
VLRVLALDFDGVISNSAPECFAVAARTYAELAPGGPFAASAAGFGRLDAPITVPAPAAVRAHRDYGAFLAAMPLGNRAEDFGVALAALERGHALSDQAAYDRFAASIPRSWIRAFHERFYRVRAALRSADPEAWLRLMEPYPAFLEVLRRRAGDVELAIATSKDRASVAWLLRAYGIEALFPDACVLDKEAGASKSAHLERLREYFDCDFADMTFVDDKVNHLDVVAGLGVRCALARWGFNGEREAELAQSAGYLVCDLDDVEGRLFD